MPELQVSIARYYHERTKYDPETIAAKSQELDWNNQPVPFKDYKIGATFDLKPYLTSQEQPASQREWQRLSRLLFCSYGLTVKLITISGDPVYLRAAPSAGSLYPAEIYLISRGTPLLPAGLYNYQSKTHSLIQFWENEVWSDLQTACFWHPTLDDTQLAIVITAVFLRSAWKYHDRAYRRVFLDTGHLLGNIELASTINDFRPHLIGGFEDAAVDRLLYLDAEQEGTIAVLPLADLLDLRQNLSVSITALPSITQTDYPHIPDGELLNYLHQATQMTAPPDQGISTAGAASDSVNPMREDKYNFPFCLKISTATPAIDWGKQLLGLESTILNRRSTRSYSGAALTFNELKALLDFSYQPHHYIEQGFDRSPDYFDLNLIETFIAVLGVEGLEAGCYYYAPKAQELRQIRFKNFRRELHFLCLGQNLGRDAGAVVFHTADLQNAVAQYGDRVYRYLHMDAGHLGQRLNLAAIHLELGVSGIAGFFDNQVNEVLGIPVDEAVLYLTTLGRPESQLK